MAGKNAHRLLTVPPADIAGYEDVLRDYFFTYRSNLMTFFTVNFATLHVFERGSLVYPAVFNLDDVLHAFDKLFKNDGSVCLKSYKHFLKSSNILDADRYAHKATSSRLQDDVLDMGYAVPCPAGRRPVVPDLDYIHQALCLRLKRLAASQDIYVSRFLPAFHVEIEEQLAAGHTQTEIAYSISQQTKRDVHQEDISRFFKRTKEVRNRLEKRSQRAAMTRDMAENFVELASVTRSSHSLQRPPA